ncbi:MAG: tRNA pseudouridine(13) synthase TruD [Candidatus Woesearchaeota archaeon]
MFKLKQIPEDFVVKELMNLKPKKDGKFAYFVLKKRNWTTLKALQVIAEKLGLRLRMFGWAGNKDKRAITEQICSVKGIGKERLEKVGARLLGQGIELTFLGRGKKPISLGSNVGNRFEIVVRGIDSMPEIKKYFVNFFGEQRFRGDGLEIGRAILHQEWAKAAELAAKKYPAVKQRLKEVPSDPIGALKQVHLKLLKFFVASYQSWLWNEMAKEYLRQAQDIEPEAVLPIIGFDTSEEPLVKNILKRESLTTKDFIIKQFPELSCEGSTRKVWIEAQGLVVQGPKPDELNPGKKKLQLNFDLPKGSYATEFIRQLFNNKFYRYSENSLTTEQSSLKTSSIAPEASTS